MAQRLNSSAGVLTSHMFDAYGTGATTSQPYAEFLADQLGKAGVKLKLNIIETAQIALV